MKKALFLVLVGVLLSVGVAFSQGTPFVGTMTVENDLNDGGDSTITMTTSTRDGVPAFRFVGTNTTKIASSYVAAHYAPDAATLTILRNLRTLTFKILGDGNRWKVEVRTSTVRDWGFHGRIINTEAGVEQTVSIPIRHFMQPSWATSVPLNTRGVTSISWISDDSVRGKDFDITIWDVRVE